MLWTCHAGHVDDASSGPPQQRQEHLTHLHSSQKVDVHAESELRERVELCVHGAAEDSRVIHQTPQACRYHTHNSVTHCKAIHVWETLTEQTGVRVRARNRFITKKDFTPSRNLSW